MQVDDFDNDDNDKYNEYFYRLTHQCIEHYNQRGPVKETTKKRWESKAKKAYKIR